MTDAPEEIWIDPRGKRWVREADAQEDHGDVEYIRADLHDALAEKWEATEAALIRTALDMRALRAERDALAARVEALEGALSEISTASPMWEGGVGGSSRAALEHLISDMRFIADTALAAKEGADE